MGRIIGGFCGFFYSFSPFHVLYNTLIYKFLATACNAFDQSSFTAKRLAIRFQQRRQVEPDYIHLHAGIACLFPPLLSADSATKTDVACIDLVVDLMIDRCLPPSSFNVQ